MHIALAVVDYSDPLLWAAFIGWILSVVLHEFGHGVVAYLGGDYTIRERGGLTLNPFQYIDPVMSILIPAIIFVVGGIPLPGGVTYVRRDLIRNRFWQIATSAAGPAMNFLLFLLLVVPFHPMLGWIKPGRPDHYTDERAYLFMGAMAWLQMLSVLYNLLPIPPLDGFQIVAQFMDEQMQQKIRSMGLLFLFIFFMAVSQVPWIGQSFHNGVVNTLEAFGFHDAQIGFFIHCYNRVLFGGD
jgi:Zn-dependent protease